MVKQNKAHIFLDEDVSEYLQGIADRLGGSVTLRCNQLIRMIKSMEETVDITLHTDTLHGDIGKPPIRFKKRLRMKIHT